MSASYTFDDLVAVMARLRGPGGCPWDRAQTPRSLRPYLLEETYETLEAIDRGEDAALCEELGDLLLQVVFQARMAEEAGGFTIGEVVDGLVRKLIERHPHVFGDTRLETAEAVLAHWHEAKQAKREAVFAGIPHGLPALARAQRVQERVRPLGFRWPDLQAAVAKAREELGELETAAGPEAAADELGDALFTLINVAIFHGVDAEQALRDATRKFIQRFTRLEVLARASGRPLREHAPEELLALWEQAKDDHAG